MGHRENVVNVFRVIFVVGGLLGSMDSHWGSCADSLSSPSILDRCQDGAQHRRDR